MSDKDITLVAVTSYAFELTKRAIERTLNTIPCREVLVMCNRNIFPDGRWIEINPITIEEYNTIMFKHLWPYIRTEHILVVQFDGMAVNAEHWSDDFMKFDYIGAVWPWPHHPPEYKVGNGGFSLRSRRLINMLKDKEIVEHRDLPPYEDLYIGVHYKDHLVRQGIKIADIDTAKRFSHEHFPDKKDTFGFHGVFNVPYYLSESDTEDFISLMPNWTNESSAMMAPHCFRAGKRELGLLALDIGRKKSKNYDDRVRTVLKQVPELRRHNSMVELQQILGMIK